MPVLLCLADNGQSAEFLADEIPESRLAIHEKTAAAFVIQGLQGSSREECYSPAFAFTAPASIAHSLDCPQSPKPFTANV